jgi:hypothetical protein
MQSGLEDFDGMFDEPFRCGGGLKTDRASLTNIGNDRCVQCAAEHG